MVRILPKIVSWDTNDKQRRKWTNAAATAEDINAVTNVVQNHIPRDWLVKTLPHPFKYVSVVKQIFIMNAGVTVKMQRTMDTSQRNLEALMQYTGLGRKPEDVL